MPAPEATPDEHVPKSDRITPPEPSGAGAQRFDEERFRLLVESVRDYAIFMLDPQGVVATWNVGAQRIKGYAAREIVGKHFSQFYPREDILAGKCEMELEYASRDGRFEDEGWRLRKDGTRFWANVIITALRDSTGTLVGFAKVTRDLTERRAAEEERLRLGRLAADRVHALTELSEVLASSLSVEDVAKVVTQQGTAFTNADTCFLYLLNESTRQLDLVSERGGNPDVVAQVHHLTRESGNPVYLVGVGESDGIWIANQSEWTAHQPELIRLDAPDVRGPRARSFGAAPLTAEGRTFGVIGVGFHDPRLFTAEEKEFIRTFARQCAQALARARRLEAERAARRAADAANRAKDEFLAVVSHELRTPLNAIMGWAKLLVHPNFDEKRRAGAIETIERNAVAMAQLIEDLLDMSRVISGKLRLEVHQVDVATIVEAAIDSVRPAAAAKGVELVPLLDPRVQPLMADPTRLQQIVWNLLSNGVKFTSRGGRVDVILRQREGSIEISVADSGKGIAPEFLPHVFDPFRQEDASPSRSRGGLGLGLAITRQLVELHGGRISVQSEGEGRGSTFSVSLPVSTALPTTALASSTARQINSASAFERPEHLRGLRVLVVDDEPDSRLLVATVLEDCGCKVTVAGSVKEALERLEEAVPDVLLSDIGMPGQDGFDLIREVRKLPRERGGDVPAAAVTAYARPEDRRRMLSAGYSIHLPKPVEPAELVAVVATLSRFMHRPG